MSIPILKLTKLKRENCRLSFAVLGMILIMVFLTGCEDGSSGPDNVLEKDLQQTFETLYDYLGIPGAMIKIRFPDGATWESVLGIREATTFPSGADSSWAGFPVNDRHTHTRAGSITKTFTATLILILAQEGRVELNRSVDYHLGNLGVDIPNSDQITVHQLLNMTSGLVDYSNSELFIQQWPPPLYTPQELIQISIDDGGAMGDGTNFEPGQGWEYCNTNYIVLALIAEAVTGETYGELVEQKILEPLGLLETSVPTPTEETIPFPNWHGYSIEMTPGVWEDFFNANMSWAWSAGNIISTRDNLMTWIQALNDGVLLRDEMKAVQKSWVETGNQRLSYGLGIAKIALYDDEELIGYLEGHNGGTPGYETSAWKYNNYYIVVMCNGDHIPGREDIGHNGDYISAEMAKLLYRAER